MDKYRIIITDHALESMREIRDYIALELYNPAAAVEHLREFRKQIKKLLSDNPDKFRAIDEQPWGDEGVRKFRVKNYYIYYWINDDDRTVYVTDVIYVGRDQPKWLSAADID